MQAGAQPSIEPVVFSDHDRPNQDRARKTVRSTVCSRAPHHRLGCVELARSGNDRAGNSGRLPGTGAGRFSRSLWLRRPHGQACGPVKLLFDENLSRKLVARLSELYTGSAHVAEFNLLERRDREIQDFARRSGFIIVTADSDFYELVSRSALPGRLPPSGSECTSRRSAAAKVDSRSTP
jgi:hypothetical protein